MGQELLLGEWVSLPWREAVATILLFAVAAVVRHLAERALRRDGEFLSDHRRRILFNIRNGLFFIGLIGLVLIWAPSLRSFALSLTAFVVAIIIATKELILCLSGAFLRATSTSFRVGHWIEVIGIHGEVIDITLLSVHIQEVHADGRSYEYTGRTVTVPNSVFLTQPVKNLNFYNRYVFHRFSLTMKPEIDTMKVEAAVLQSLRSDMAPHEDVARRFNALIERKAALDIMGTEPTVHLEVGHEGRVRMEVVMFLPTHQAVTYEQNAVRAGLAEIRAQLQASG